MAAYPKVIQGGMGVAVSSWQLARVVSQSGQLGVVSGTGLDTVLARRLQRGDVGGHLRYAFDNFPVRDMAERVWQRYFVAGGKPQAAPYKSKPIPNIRLPRALVELIVVANFSEVFLAKEGHDGIVGINLLEKIQIPTLPSLFGAMLAGVDYVLMGAGIPRAIPAILDSLSVRQPTELKVDVVGALPGEEYTTRFDPRDYCDPNTHSLARPKFLAIISSATLATSLVRKGTGRVDGFVVEGATAGGHNAPPRGGTVVNEQGEPIYGPRDVADLEQIRELGLPFWLAGSFGDPEKLRAALDLGAQGVQVGTAFAFCEESGLDPDIRARVISRSMNGAVTVFTDPLASPTGFPFKVVEVEGTSSQEDVYGRRERICDLGYLRTPYRTQEGKVGYRCPGEPVSDFVEKGGALAETTGRKCLCNGLLAAIGLGQLHKGKPEPAIITAGDDVSALSKLIPPGKTSYSAKHVLSYLLSGIEDSSTRAPG